MVNRVFVVGVGMTPFTKPKSDPNAGPHYPELAEMAITRALTDAKLTDNKKVIEAAFAGSLFSIGAGQRCLYQVGIYDIPVTNCNNACATGSNALALARQSIMAGINDCALAFGVEKMKPGSLGGGAGGGASPLDVHYGVLAKTHGFATAPPMSQFFGYAGLEHMKKYGTKKEHFAMIGEKNHRHSANNPYSQFRDVYSLEDIMKSPTVMDPLTKLQCSPTSDGAAAAILCSEAFVIRHGLQGQAVEIIGQSMRSDTERAFTMHDTSVAAIEVIGSGMASRCASDVYNESGLGPDDIDVVELHDCFSSNELITYEALGLAKEGEGGKLIESGNATFGGKYVINPSGGLISKGHPLGATGVAQCAELCWQLRNECGPRQVAGAKVGLQHNLGLGGLCVVTMYSKPAEWRGIAPRREISLAMGPPTSSNL